MTAICDNADLYVFARPASNSRPLRSSLTACVHREFRRKSLNVYEDRMFEHLQRSINKNVREIVHLKSRLEKAQAIASAAVGEVGALHALLCSYCCTLCYAGSVTGCATIRTKQGIHGVRRICATFTEQVQWMSNCEFPVHAQALIAKTHVLQWKQRSEAAESGQLRTVGKGAEIDGGLIHHQHVLAREAVPDRSSPERIHRKGVLLNA